MRLFISFCLIFTLVVGGVQAASSGHYHNGSKISLVLHATGGITNFKCKDMVIAHMSVTASTGNFHGTYISPETHAQYNVTGAVKPHEDTILISVYHHDAVTGLTYFCNTSAIKAK